MVVWRISDGRAGHDTQSTGLLQALAAIKDCSGHELRTLPVHISLMGSILGRFPAGASLPDPDFIIGAGHGTHLPLLAAGRARGGNTVVLMKPTLPVSLFDYCLIPAHDLPPARDNILATQGVLNCAVPSREQIPTAGMILIGGASRHYGWDAPGLARQIREICAVYKNSHWLIADSPRTPAATRLALAGIDYAGLEFVPHETTNRGWLAERLRYAATVWVTEDSISMICEALSAGAAVGIMSVPIKRRGRITRAVDNMAQAGLITRYSAWRAGALLRPPDPPLHEAARCARWLLEKTGLG